MSREGRTTLLFLLGAAAAIAPWLYVLHGLAGMLR